MLKKQIYTTYREIIAVHEKLLMKVCILLNNTINEYVLIFPDVGLNRLNLLLRLSIFLT